MSRGTERSRELKLKRVTKKRNLKTKIKEQKKLSRPKKQKAAK